jgi:hypothetical protein
MSDFRINERVNAGLMLSYAALGIVDFEKTPTKRFR